MRRGALSLERSGVRLGRPLSEPLNLSRSRYSRAIVLSMAGTGFHPAVAAWFGGRFGSPTECQMAAWPAIQERRHALVAAPTGSGKTLAAFLSAIDELVRLAAPIRSSSERRSF